MFERFTDRVRQVMVLAQNEARALNHGFIGTEHLLLGLLSEGGGVAATTMTGLGITLTGARDHVEDIIGRGHQPPSGAIPFTPRAKDVLVMSITEATQLHCNYVNTEHILLALLTEGNGVAVEVLSRYDLRRVRSQLMAALPTYL